MITMFLRYGGHPEPIRTYREEEIRCKSDRKQITREGRVLAAKLERQQTWGNAA
jgi:hypothetical protein